MECGGLGTKGSEGFETCGTDLEIDAFKCVIEWLTGDRTAYTDRTGNIAIEADWSNGNVGMTGRSYAGTTQFGLATTGVKGLKTIVPVAGIASWYDYTNSQGVSTGDVPNYSDDLAAYCAGRYLDEEDYATIADAYGLTLQNAATRAILPIHGEAMENPFQDVSADAFYTDAVLWAVQTGVAKGTSASPFSPDAACTRGQIVTFLYRAMK